MHLVTVIPFCAHSVGHMIFNHPSELSVIYNV